MDVLSGVGKFLLSWALLSLVIAWGWSRWGQIQRAYDLRDEKARRKEGQPNGC